MRSAPGWFACSGYPSVRRHCAPGHGGGDRPTLRARPRAPGHGGRRMRRCSCQAREERRSRRQASRCQRPSRGLVFRSRLESDDSDRLIAQAVSVPRWAAAAAGAAAGHTSDSDGGSRRRAIDRSGCAQSASERVAVAPLPHRPHVLPPPSPGGPPPRWPAGTRGRRGPGWSRWSLRGGGAGGVVEGAGRVDWALPSHPSLTHPVPSFSPYPRHIRVLGAGWRSGEQS